MNELTSNRSTSASAPENIPEEIGLIETGVRNVLILTAILAVLAIPLMNLVHPSVWQRGIGFWHSLFSFLSAGFNVAAGHGIVPAAHTDRNAY